jgi:hypothetical protein
MEREASAAKPASTTASPATDDQPTALAALRTDFESLTMRKS